MADADLVIAGGAVVTSQGRRVDAGEAVDATPDDGCPFDARAGRFLPGPGCRA